MAVATRRGPSGHGEAIAGEIFMMAIWRHASTFGDTHRHMATHFPIWRQASQRRDSRENLITFCIQLVPVRMLSKRWQAGEIKKAKVEALLPYRHPRWLKGLGMNTTHGLTPSSDTTTKKFQRRYRLDKKSVIELAEDFGTFCILQSAIAR